MRGTARIATAATVGMAGLLLAACTPPEGVDGDLMNGWQAMPEPVGFVPEAGVCHQEDYLEAASLADYAPLDCESVHRAETVHVGEFTGDVAERVTPPTPGSAAWQSAYQQCDEAAATYLGADFRYAELWLGVVVPSPEAWEGGARWLRCDVRDHLNGDLWAPLAGTLGDGSSELLLGCFVATVSEDNDTVDDMEPVACTEPHDAEFVGVHKVSGNTYPEEDSAWRRIHDGCLTLVAEFVGVPDDGDLPFRSGTIAVPMERTDWDNGDRGIRCYMWLDGTEVSESLRDAGEGGLPIR